MWYWECFTPHPPIVIPEVGRGREREAEQTIRGFEGLRRLTGSNTPDFILLLSPHAPFGGGITFSAAETYAGDFSMFGAPVPKYNFGGAMERTRGLAEKLSEEFPVFLEEKQHITLDHGALVPLASLFSGKKAGRVKLVLANPIGLSLEQAYGLGQALAGFEDTASWALVSSGDLSHRVSPDAPAGYSPAGAPFDKKVTEAFKKNTALELLSLSPREIEAAGECGLRSALIFLGLGKERGTVLLSYEAPFGVGYAVAYASLHAAPDLARSVISRVFEKNGDPPVKEAERFLRFPELREKSACFVSLKKNGDLRGCIGTIFPRSGSLAMEICENAIAAAFHDPRFPPLSRDELDTVSISVDILSTPEQITGIEELNPSKYGVVVEKNGARGVLLPDLEGVETVEQQLSIAARKAGITTLQGALISRFSVLRVREAGRS